jgi:hypothetical protein
MMPVARTGLVEGVAPDRVRVAHYVDVGRGYWLMVWLIASNGPKNGGDTRPS